MDIKRLKKIANKLQIVRHDYFVGDETIDNLLDDVIADIQILIGEEQFIYDLKGSLSDLFVCPQVQIDTTINPGEMCG
jgi:hypothetical protein